MVNVRPSEVQLASKLVVDGYGESVSSRRAFFATAAAGLVAWPLVARAQTPTMPVVGFLSGLAARDRARIVPAFRQGLGEVGYVEGLSLAIEYRWAEGHYERLPALAADLVRRHVAVIAALSGTPSGLAARAATATIATGGSDH
jgi:putative ABC transport system substrate-binding protein